MGVAVVTDRAGAARDVFLVARFELGEALRSRLLLVMLLLFMSSGALSAWGYSAAVGRFQEQSAEVMIMTGERSADSAMLRRGSPSYRDMLRAWLGDDKKADYLAAIPPIVVFFAWASFTFTPWLILLTSAESIAAEVATRSIRFSALRTSRLSLALGKALGQAWIVAGVTALQALTFFLVARLTLHGFEPAATALGLLSFWPRVMTYILPFLSWAMFASMTTASANFARVVSLGGALCLALFSGIAGSRWVRGGTVRDTVWDLFGYLTPFGHSNGLWYPVGGKFFGDIAVCLALTVLYFGMGFAVLRKRDL
jgi:hypothetical protein